MKYYYSYTNDPSEYNSIWTEWQLNLVKMIIEKVGLDENENPLRFEHFVEISRDEYMELKSMVYFDFEEMLDALDLLKYLVD